MIYLLHSTTPLKRASGQLVYHYLGWCRDGHLDQRLHDHRTGHNTSRIVKAFLRHGGSLVLTAIWPNASRADERRLKVLGHLASHCAVCTQPEGPVLLRTMPRRYPPRAS